MNPDTPEYPGTFAVMALDILTAVMANVDDFDALTGELAQHLRELTGARTLAIIQTLSNNREGTAYRLLRVAPERRAGLFDSAEGHQLLELAVQLDQPTFWSPDDGNASAGVLLPRLEHGISLVIPITVGNVRHGALVALGLIDITYAESLIEVHAVLSGIIAMIIKNSQLLEERRQRADELEQSRRVALRLMQDAENVAAALRRSETRLEEAQRIARLGNWVWEIPDNRITWSDEVYRIFGFEPRSFVPTYEDFLECVHPDDRDRVDQDVRASLDNQAPYSVEHRIKRPDGKERFVHEEGEITYDETDRPIRMVGTVQDITERMRTQLALEERSQELDAIFNSAPMVTMLVDTEGHVDRINLLGIEAAGKSERDIIGRLVGEVVGCVHAMSREGCGRGEACKSCPIRTSMKSAFESYTEQGNVEGSLVFEVDGKTVEKYFLISTRLVPLHSGNRVLVGLNDITERKWMEEELKKHRDRLEELVGERTAKLRETEEQLLQSQKLEAVGQLAGGVAHDFNNLLTVILGYGDTLLLLLHRNDPMRRDVEQIMDAGERASSLTRQLLAFSRKQTLQPEVLDLNNVVRDMEKMLFRLIGEDIDLATFLGDDLWLVNADPGQIEQVIMNLAVNARDAMPQGGRLTIETVNVENDEEYAKNHLGVVPGQYVMLAITDSGCGMDEDTRSKIFEPFFTTKGQTKGTGLGLSTVYGIVKQSGGHIWVYSEPGRGATFKIFLPCMGAGPIVPAEQRQVVKQLGRGKKLLVVEDEPALRELLQRMLEGLDYRVTVAANGGEALIAIEEEGLQPDLLITDVVMPGMSGSILAKRLRKTLPDLKVLYMSGYTDNAIVHHGVLDPGVPFIQKPFNQNQLGSKIQMVLDSG